MSEAERERKEDLVKRLRDGCSCNIDTSPCAAEEECRDAYAAADRIEGLEADLRKMALDYLAAQGQASENFQMYVDANEARIDAEAKLSESEALLEKAVKALDEAWFMLTVPHLNYEPEPEEPGLRRIKTALAELKERTQ